MKTDIFYSKVSEYQFTDKVVVRSPLLSKDSIKNETEIYKNLFPNALYLGSKNIYDYFKGNSKVKFEDKLELSLFKYLRRAHTRCTPFGMFAGVHTVNWGNGKSVSELKDVDYKFKNNIDLSVELIQKIITLGKSNNAFIYNSYYCLNQTIIIDTKREVICFRGLKQINGKVRFANVEITTTPFLLKLLELSKFRKYNFYEIVEFLIEDNQEMLEPCKAFILELIEDNFFFNALIGANSKQNIDCFNEIFSASNPELTNKINDNLKNSENPYNNIEPIHNDLKLNLKTLFPTLKLDDIDIVKTDLIKTPNELCYIQSKLQFPLRLCISFLADLSSKNNSSTLKNVKEIFALKYENDFIPFLNVFNPITGINFKSNKIFLKGLFKNIKVTKSNSKETSTSTSNLSLLNKIYNAKNDSFKVELLEVLDLKGLQKKAFNLPPSISIAGSLHRVTEQEEIFTLKYINRNGTSLMNRFSADSKIKSLADSISSQEEVIANKSEYSLGEISLKPCNRLGNITNRKINRKNHISFNESTNSVNSLFLSDLEIKLDYQTNKFVIRNIKTKQNLLIFHSTALNPAAVDSPIISFLTSINMDNYMPIKKFSWGPLKSVYTHFPRLSLKSIIISPEMWILNQEEIEAIISVADNNIIKYFDKKQIPKSFIYELNEDETYFNLTEKKHIQTFKKLLKGKSKIVIKENTHNYSLNTLPQELLIPLVRQK